MHTNLCFNRTHIYFHVYLFFLHIYIYTHCLWENARLCVCMKTYTWNLCFVQINKVCVKLHRCWMADFCITDNEGKWIGKNTQDRLKINLVNNAKQNVTQLSSHQEFFIKMKKKRHVAAILTSTSRCLYLFATSDQELACRSMPWSSPWFHGHNAHQLQTLPESWQTRAEIRIVFKKKIYQSLATVCFWSCWWENFSYALQADKSNWSYLSCTTVLAAFHNVSVWCFKTRRIHSLQNSSYS